MNKIAIIYTTFLRDSLEKKTIQSILDNWNENYILLIGDQGVENKDTKNEFYNNLNNKNIYRYILPFDYGLSASRNFLVEKAKELNCKYCFLTADSIKFLQPYDLQIVIDFLEEDPRRGIVGFNLEKRICWEGDLELKEKFFYLDAPQREFINFKNIIFQPVDICRNFFLAKTKCLLDNKWDNNLKLLEHEDFFWRLKNNYISFIEEFGTDIYQPYQVFYTKYIKGEYIEDKPKEYLKYRNRMYNEFKKKLEAKYNFIFGWDYSPAFRKRFRKWKI